MDTTLHTLIKQLIFVIFLYFGTTFAYFNPHKDPYICGRPTCNPLRKFNFTRDTVYEYKYTVDIKTLFAGSSENASKLHITSLATVTFLTECEAVLQVSDLKLSEEADGYNREEDLDIESPAHPESFKFAEDVQQYPLRFAFHDGAISEICPEFDETNWVLNFKRGLLSMFQNTMQRFDMDHSSIETDVNGVCNTAYLLNGAQESSLVVDKHKDISSCHNRYKHHSILQTTPYHFRSSANQIPIMQSSSDCTMVIDHSIYVNIICKERHMFKPFSNKDSGATTLTTQQLQLTRETTISPSEIDMVPSRKSLLFDHLPTPKISSGELKQSRNMLKDMCTYSKGDIQIEFSDVFSKFIQYARLLPYTTLTMLYSRSSQICETGKKHILDALPFLGTDASIQIMKDLIIKKEIDETAAKEWVFSFAFVPRPTVVMLEAMTELLQQEEVVSTLPLSAGTMVHMYCRWFPDCENEEVVQNIISNIEEQVKKNYQSRFNDRTTRDKLLFNVKALGNMGILSENFEDTLKTMINDLDLPMEIRVAVVNAHRRQLCSESQPYFMKLYTNFEADTEIRIAAYLQAMQCPNYALLQQIRYTLITEEVNQVGSFVWTHLTNLLKSSVPSRVEIQGLLSDKDLGRKFSSDVRKFSHNYEGSLFFEEYNAGGSYDINTIFSPKSYVPRTLSLNLTACLFGESINLFEMNTRFEGFEHYLESLFGPNRTFSAKNIKEKVSKIRFFRSVDDNEVMKSQIAALPNVVEDNFDEPQVSFGVKFFGNELLYNSFIGDREIYNGLQKLNMMNYLKRILSGKEISYNKAIVFLDTSYIVPSGTGLPVTLNAAGTAALNLKMIGMLKAEDFIKTGILDLKGHLRPSMAVDVIGTMSVDAYYASTGIKLKSNLYSSYDVEGDIKIRGPQLISVQFKLPQNKTEIFGAQSELIVMKGDKEEYQTDVTGDPVQQSYCTWPILDRTIGLKMCTDFKFPNVSSVRNSSSSFIFHGPTKIRMYIEKADPTADVYFLQYRWDKTNTTNSLSLHFDTPGSKVNRMMNANFTLNLQHQNVSFIVTSHKEKFSAIGNYKNTPEEKSIEVSMDVDGTKHFNGHLGYRVEPTTHGNTYYPKFYVGVNAERIVELSGTLQWVTKKNVSQCEVNIKFETKKLKTQVFGYISKTENFIEANLEMNYKFEEKKEENIKLHCKLSQIRKTLFKSITGEFKLETTAYPHLNFISALKYQKASGHIECKIEMNNGPNMELEENKLTILTVFSCYKTNNGTKLNTLLAITRPSSQVDVKFQIQHSQIGADTNTRVLVRYAENKEVIVTLYLSVPYKPLFEIDLALNVTVPSFTPMMIEIQIDEKRKSIYDVQLKGVWFSGHMATAKGHYQDWSTPSKSEHIVKLRIESPSFTDVIADGQYYRDNNNYKINAVLLHEADIYSLLLKHSVETATDIISYAEIKYKQQIYSATSIIDIKDKRQLTLELHFDQLRDVYIVFKNVNLPQHKFLGGEIKWDSNRDPSQKLGGSLEYFRYDAYNTSGNFLFTYPGRAVNGFYAFAVKDTQVRSSARFAWHPTKVIDVSLNSDFKHDKEQILLILQSELLTPFESWEKTSFNGGIHHRDNLYRINGSVYWRYDQFIATDLYTNYSINVNQTEAEFKTSLVSTIKDIPSIACNLKHYQDSVKLDQKIYLMYNPNQIITINSTWILEKEKQKDNFVGTVSLSTPFDGYKRGILQSKISFIPLRKVQGYASVDLDNRHFTASCEGHLTKLTNNLFVFNVTTPMDKYKTIRGRFGLNEDERHLEATVKYPAGAVGIEILFRVHSLSNFNIMFDIGTPLDFLTKLLVIAKLKEDALDFRVGWNTLLVGFAGVWRYANVADFEYAYKLYTPIEGVEVNGIVARFIYDKGLDTEMSIQLANTRLGFIVLGQPKPKLFQGLGLKAASPILLEARPRYRIPDSSEEEEDIVENSEPEDVDDGLSWTAQAEVDIAVYPTIKGVFDIDEVGSLYTVIATVSLPDGNIDIRDEFNLEDVFTMNNRLLITTPFKNFNRITSKYDFEIVLGRNYLVGMDFNYKNSTEWVSIGYEVNYNLALRDDEELEVHSAKAHLHTPFVGLPQLDIEGKLEIDENHYRGNASLDTNTTHIDLSGVLEKDEGFLDSNLRVTMASPFLIIEPTLLIFKKDYSEVENSVEFGLEKIAIPKNPFRVELMWQKPTKEKLITAKLRIMTPSVVLQNFEVSAIIEKNIAEKSAYAKLRFECNDNALEVNGTLKDNVIRSEISTFIEPYKSVSLILNQRPDINKPGYYNLQGQMIVKKNIIEIGGVYVIQKNTLGYFKLQTKNGATLEYKITPQTDGFRCLINIDDPQTKINFKVISRVEFIHKLDWFFKLETESSNPKWNLLGLETEVRSPQPNNITVNINTNTQLSGLKNIHADFNLLFLPNSAGIGVFTYDIDEYEGTIEGHWNWIVMENMQFKLLADYKMPQKEKNYETHVFYINTERSLSNLKVGGDFNVDKHHWTIGSNITFALSSENNIDAEFNLKLPKPHPEVHTIRGEYHKFDDTKIKNLNGLVRYTTQNSLFKYAISGGLNNNENKNVTGGLKVEWGPKPDQFIDNKVDMKLSEIGLYNIKYDLFTPKYLKENTFSTHGTYGKFDNYHNITLEVHQPESLKIFSTKVDYHTFSNMNGTVNSTTPFITFPYIGAHFNSKATSLYTKRFVEAFWPNNTAIFDSMYNYIFTKNNRGGKGKLLIEVPLTTRHYLNSNYGYNEKPNHKEGYATMDYNKVNIINGKYNCESELRAGFQKDIINLEVENKLQPIGINYVHQINTEAAIDGFSPTLDFKRAELFKLNNKTAFNITGEFSVQSTFTGEKYRLMAHHMNRTVVLNTDYDILDQQFLNKARLDLAPEIWFAYDLNLLNKTFDFNSESQQIELELAYPRRNVTVLGSYNVSSKSLASELSLTWDKWTQLKTVEVALDWTKLSTYPNHHKALFELRHPSFEKNVSFLGEYKSDKVNLADVKLEIEYSVDQDQKVELGANLQDHCKDEKRNFTFSIFGTHPATRLELLMTGGLDYYSKYYHTYNQAKYKRTYLPLQSGESSATLNILENEVELKKATQRDLTYFWMKSAGLYPVYTINSTLVYGEETDGAAEFYLNLYEKEIRLEGNRTPDATESVHMLGKIPNARSAAFEFYRDYDDIRIYDITYYLQLNHSRLITSRLLWRPEIKQDLKESFKQASQSLYDMGVENIEFWKRYIRSETGDAVADIWADAKPLVQGCLDDMNDLNVLEEDIETFKIFVNESYNNNEFYIRDAVSFAMYLIDELAIRDHIESVPEIVNEIWEIMGESGKALRKSLQWLVTTLKESYKKLVQFINDVMHGEALDQISKMIEYFIHKYDTFIKELHVMFIRYVEKLWHDTSVMLVNHWNRMLAAIEPTFLKFIHYGETVIWNASKEFLDFLYKRKHEIEESPYFMHFANFTQDIDRFYKDMIHNSIITNIRKYSQIFWAFIKEKYFSMIPFGKELSNVFNEIITELQELKKLPSLQFVITKYDEMYDKVVWFYEYMKIGDIVQKVVTILHMKITEITQTALDQENRYREAKTKFIFDPETGLMELEQKLPMSWHAFNETPKFMEIPEIRAINDAQNYLVMSNKSFWMLYYQYKPYTEPHTWVPPFDSYAMVVGPQHFVTFDGQHYDFSGSCSYLLAKDFMDSNFSMIIHYNTKDKVVKHKIDLFIDDVLIEVDLFADNVKLLKKGVNTKLPLQLEKAYIYRVADTIIIDSLKGFTLKCNLKFDICKFQVSGWYFGKTAGLWGTMNNEPRDDHLASTKKINNHIGRFAQSWSLQPKKCRSTANQAKVLGEPSNENLEQLCEAFFRSKVSPLNTCFPIVNVIPYYNLCMNYPNRDNRTSCTAAVAYMEACKLENTPLRIPDVCVQCQLINGTDIPEGQFLNLDDESVPKSADIVFIVEAKDCNANISTKRNMNQVVSLIQKELTDLKLINNRYSLVVFGGPGIYSEPRSIIVNNQIFTTHQTIPHYFENIPTGNGSSDIFNAISFAKELIFRPGVSKTMILLPCTDCQADNMKLDYPVLHQLLRENDITLHILMNNDFVFPKSRINKIFYGIDSNTAYTKKDVKELKGDVGLRRQVKLPKADLGFCTPLALETNGSVFTATKLQNDKRGAIKKFATVFAKRVAQTAVPNSCQTCECTANSDGTSYMECLPCEYPTALSIDYGFNEDDSFLSYFQQTTDFEDDSEEFED